MSFKRFPRLASLWRKIFRQDSQKQPVRAKKNSTEKTPPNKSPKYSVVRISGEVVAVIDVTES